MAKYQVETDQGTFEVETEESQPRQTEGLFGSSVGENSDILRKARIPSQMVEGLSEALMDATEPKTTSVPLNFLMRTPQTLASIGTKNVSSFISPESIISQLGLKAAQLSAPAIKALGRWVGKGAESVSGLNYERPGALGKAFEKPSRILGKGTQAAGEIYDDLIDRTKVRGSMKGPKSFADVVDEGYQALGDGSITEDEALVARRALDRIRKSMPKDNYFELRDSFDKIAKTKFAGADEAFKEALTSEALREALPLNKSGTPSKFLTGMSGLGIGTAMKTGNPIYAALGLATSPAVQGAASAGLGVGAQVARPFIQNPQLGALGEIIRREMERKR